MNHEEQIAQLRNLIRGSKRMAHALVHDARKNKVDQGIIDVLRDVASDLSLAMGDLDELKPHDFRDGCFRKAR